MNLYTMSFHPYGGYYTNNSQRQRYHYYYENNMQQLKTVVPDMQQSGGDEDRESGKVPNIVQSSASIDRTQMARVLVPPVMVCSVAASSNNIIYTKETSGSRPDDKLQLRGHLLDISEVALELEKLKIAVEEKIRKYKKVVKQYEKKLNEVDRADAWDVIRIMVTEEHRSNRTFNTLNEFLDHWFYTCHDYQEDSKLEAMYRKDSNGQKERGPTGVQEEAQKRYRELNRTDKAIYRAVAKQYFKKRLSIATDTANECDLEFRGMLKLIGNVISDVIYRPN